MELGDPVVQAVEHKASDDWMVAVERVAAARVVRVAPVGVEHVVGLVVDSPEGDRGAALIPLRRVVEDHVEDHRDAGRMERLDQCLELRDLRAVMAGCGVPALGGVESDRAVTPVVAKPATGRRIHELVLGLVELEDGH